MTKVAIVGATGPTGIHLAAALRETTAAVRVIARGMDKLARLFPEAAIEKRPADILDADATLRAVDGCDLVYDCIGLPGDQMHLRPVTARNIAGALRHTEARCVQVSSYWAYYPQVRAEMDESHPRSGGPPGCAIGVKPRTFCAMPAPPSCIYPTSTGPRCTCSNRSKREPIEYLAQRVCLFHLHGEITCRARLIFADVVMKLIAHRGWSAGGDENTLATFARAACDDRIAGVEFDVCYAANAMTLVVSHDPPLHIENTLTLDAALSFLSQTDLELFVEIKETGLASVVIEKLVSSNVADRSVVFAFAAVARSFPVGGCATRAPGRHCHVSMESESRGACVCAGCPFPRLGRARLDADRVPYLVVRFHA
jgi:hypothetical protein